MELKQVIAVKISPTDTGLKSHHCGIETSAWLFRRHGSGTLNRTTMELKPQYDCVPEQQHPLKSHHCGIETEGKRQPRVCRPALNRTTVELKLFQKIILGLAIRTLNRTTVELKHSRMK